jgi:hypothetical protein
LDVAALARSAHRFGDGILGAIAMGIPIQRPTHGLDKSNLVRVADELKILPASRRIVQGWKEIASELDRGVRTVQRWERILKLPVRRIGRGPRCPVFAFQDELLLWLNTRADAGAFTKHSAQRQIISREALRSSPRKAPHNGVLMETQMGKRATAKPEPEVLKSLNAFFALDGASHKLRNCARCQSPTEFLVGQFWLYGTDKTWQVSVPFCPGCDAEIRNLLPSATAAH